MLGGQGDSGKLASTSARLLGKDEWHLLDASEMRLAVLPAVKTLLSYHDSSGGTCDKQCKVFKGMDIGRGNPHEFQVGKRTHTTHTQTHRSVMRALSVLWIDGLFLAGGGDLSGRLLLGMH